MIIVKKTLKRDLDSNNYEKKLNLITRERNCNLKDKHFYRKGFVFIKVKAKCIYGTNPCAFSVDFLHLNKIDGPFFHILSTFFHAIFKILL